MQHLSGGRPLVHTTVPKRSARSFALHTRAALLHERLRFLQHRVRARHAQAKGSLLLDHLDQTTPTDMPQLLMQAHQLHCFRRRRDDRLGSGVRHSCTGPHTGNTVQHGDTSIHMQRNLVSGGCHYTRLALLTGESPAQLREHPQTQQIGGELGVIVHMLHHHRRLLAMRLQVQFHAPTQTSCHLASIHAKHRNRSALLHPKQHARIAADVHRRHRVHSNLLVADRHTRNHGCRSIFDLGRSCTVHLASALRVSSSNTRTHCRERHGVSGIRQIGERVSVRWHGDVCKCHRLLGGVTTAARCAPRAICFQVPHFTTLPALRALAAPSIAGCTLLALAMAHTIRMVELSLLLYCHDLGSRGCVHLRQASFESVDLCRHRVPVYLLGVHILDVCSVGERQHHSVVARLQVMQQLELVHARGRFLLSKLQQHAQLVHARSVRIERFPRVLLHVAPQTEQRVHVVRLGALKLVHQPRPQSVGVPSRDVRHLQAQLVRQCRVDVPVRLLRAIHQQNHLLASLQHSVGHCALRSDASTGTRFLLHRDRHHDRCGPAAASVPHILRVAACACIGCCCCTAVTALQQGYSNKTTERQIQTGVDFLVAPFLHSLRPLAPVRIDHHPSNGIEQSLLAEEHLRLRPPRSVPTAGCGKTRHTQLRTAGRRRRLLCTHRVLHVAIMAHNLSR